MNFTAIAAIVAFLTTAVGLRFLIPSLTKFKFGQQIREDGPKHHLQKQGTPTMGGIVIVFGFLLAAFIFAWDVPEVRLVMLATAGFGFIGFVDDFIKIKKKRSLGLKAYQKIIAQLVTSNIFIVNWRMLPSYSTEILIPFYLQTIDLGAFFPFLVCGTFVSTANGANLTDGLDGLASGVTVIIATFFLVIAMWAFNAPITPAIGAMIGALLGFMLFNSHPAKVYMGDTGSLALGGFIAVVAILFGMQLFLLIVAIIYVIESMSVIIQVGYFKLTRGKRFFKMAPIHHSFELKGWPETKIVALFMIITAIACMTALIGF